MYLITVINDLYLLLQGPDQMHTVDVGFQALFSGKVFGAVGAWKGFQLGMDTINVYLQVSGQGAFELAFFALKDPDFVVNSIHMPL